MKKTKQMKKTLMKDLTLCALLAVILVITGLIKTPGIIPGTEFQLSAPIAVAMAGCFGFKKYLCSGIAASMIHLLLGTHTIINLVISMVFRVVVGILIGVFGNNTFMISVSGPIGTFIGRILLSMLTGVSFAVIIVPTIPGMIYTLLSAGFIYKVMRSIVMKTDFRDFLIKVNKLRRSSNVI